jgi:hypothetical protein
MAFKFAPVRQVRFSTPRKQGNKRRTIEVDLTAVVVDDVAGLGNALFLCARD